MKPAFSCAVYALVLALAVPFITPKLLFADEKSHLKLAEEFMVLAETRKMMEETFTELRSEQLKEIDEVTYPGKTPKKHGELKKRAADYLDNKLAWENFREGYAKVYADLFSEEELKELLKFYSTPVGKKVLNSAQDLTMKLLLSTQDQLKGMIFELKQIENSFVSEQAKKKGEQEAQ